MMHVQKYLTTHTLDDLTSEYGIKVTEHSRDPLVILNYDQLDSPKTDPIVRECRGLVLERDTWQVVARAFPRFFNWGEVQDEMALFDWSSVSVTEKVDGSLCLFYWYDGHWRVNMRGSFADGPMRLSDGTWSDKTWNEAIGEGIGGLGEWPDLVFSGWDADLTAVGEFVSPWNKVVRSYDKPAVYLLSIFDSNGVERNADVCDRAALETGMLRPETYRLHGIDEVQAYLAQRSETDPTFEGVVIRDRHGHRWKIKSPTYLALHRMLGNGGFDQPKNLLPFVLAGEDDEVLSYFPEAATPFYRLKSQVSDWYASLVELWAETHHIGDQKSFALRVKHHPFAGLLFNLRKHHGDLQTVALLRQAWRESEAQILKQIETAA